MSIDNETDPSAHWAFETKQIHVGQVPDAATNARALPIYQTTSYTFNDTAHAAETIAILNIAGTGDHIVSSPRLYGGTYNLFHYSLPKLGIDVSFVEDPDDLESWRAAARPNTKAFFRETISKPQNH